MSKKIIAYLLIVVFLTSTCTSDDPDTSLEIIAISGNGTTFSYLPGAAVELRQVTPGAVSQLVATGTTDANGKILFTGLQPVMYSWSIRKGCMNNAFLQSNGQSHLVEGPLVAGIKNPFTTGAPKKGFLKVINNNSLEHIFIHHINEALVTSVTPGSFHITDFVEGINRVFYYPRFNQSLQTAVDVSIQCGDTTVLVIP